MPERICAVSVTEIIDSGRFSYRFIATSRAPVEFQRLADVHGTLTLRQKSENELNPWTLSVGPDGRQKWEIHLCPHLGVTYVAADEDPGEELGLRGILTELHDCVLLIEDSIADRLSAACSALGIRLDVHRYDGRLSTS